MTNFKKDYSDYRRKIYRANLFGTSDNFRKALKSNLLFFKINSKTELTVSKKIFLFKNHKDIYCELYKCNNTTC